MRGILKRIMAGIISLAAAVPIISVPYTVKAVSENTQWDFSAYSENSVTADGELTEEYNGLEIHLNSGDSITGDGLVWSAPGTTKSDNTSVTNNRYIKLEPTVSGTISVTFSGSIYNSSSKAARMYIVPGDDITCMSKKNSDENGSQVTATAANKATTLTAEIDAGKIYYIWPYYYNSTACAFTVTDISYSIALPEMKTRNIYESNMLLQRDKPIYIDGTCSAAVTSATVSLVNEATDATVETVNAVIENKEWNATLSAVSDYENTYKLIIESDGMEDIVYTNIIFGDQYLFTSQSNMWMSVAKYKNIDKDAYSESAVTPHLTDKIRLMYTLGQSDYGTNKLQFDAQNKQSWRDFSTYSNVQDVGAPAFTAAVKMHEETGVPIGVIDNAYPGSYISSWFDSALAIDNCNLGKNGTSNERNWYCGRIYPLRNLELSGVFWYQGCADAATTYHDNPYEYYSEMMPRLIDSWRELFDNETLPFYYTQLSRIGTTVVDENNPDTGSAGKMPIKFSQTDVYLNLEDKTNIGVVSTLDLYGNYNASGERNCRTDIHLGQKQFVGNRMAALALSDIYEKTEYTDSSKIYRMGPIYKSSKREGSSVVVTFDCNGQLAIMPSSQYTDSTGVQKITDGEFDPTVLNEFELAGDDGVWYAAKAEITAENQITVMSESVTEPTSVRYCGSDYPETPNLTDESGLPSYVFSKSVEEAPEYAVKVTATYDESGNLKSVKAEDIIITGEENFAADENSKIFIWKSLESMQPLTDVITPIPESDYTEIYSFEFGSEKTKTDSVSVSADTAYGEQSDGMTYGLVNISEESVMNDIKFDGFSDDILAYVKNGENYVTADYSQYDEETLSTFGDGVIPVRFAMAAEPAGYYTVTATVVNTSETENAEVSLFGENRYMILYNYTLAPGEKITKTWNVNLVGQYFNSTGAYTDSAVNVAVSGKNAGLSSVEIKKNKEAGKTIWLMTDSTGDNSSASLPYFGLRGKCGSGQLFTKYLNPEIAVNNQGEGGLTSADKNHLNNALKYLKAGDYLYVQYGFNGETTTSLVNNLPRYYEAAHSAGAKLIVASTTERQSSSFWDSSSYTWTASNSGIAAAGKQYVEDMIANGADDIAFVDLNTAMNNWMNEETVTIKERRNQLGFSDENPSRLAMNYYYGYDRDSGIDNVHINDAGADNAAYLVMQEMKKTVENGGVQAEVLRELTLNAPNAEPYRISDEIIAKGWVPNDSYPYPLPSDVTYEYPTIVKDIEITDNNVVSIKVMVQGNMQYYAQGAVDILDSEGNVVKTAYSTSTDINPLIDHIDNTACSYGEIYTMYFEDLTINDGESVRAYTVALPSGAELPTDERYSSYYIPDETETVLISEDFSSGIDGWNTGGSAAVKETAAVTRDGKTAIKVSENGSGTYNVYRRFDNNAEVSNGILKTHFMINYVYGNFIIRLTTSTSTGSFVYGMKTINITDGILSFEDGTEIGEIKSNKWTDITCYYDFINGTQSVSVAGGTPVSVEIAKLKSETVDDVSSILPIRGFAVAYMSTGSTIPSYSFEAYLSDITVESLKCELPRYTVTAEPSEGCEEFGTVNGGGEYEINTAVELSAKAVDGYAFVGWYDEDGNQLSKSAYYTLRVRCDKSLYAKFEEEIIDPNVTKWTFSAFDGDAEVKATSAADAEYNGLTIHINNGDSITAEGLYWNAPGGTKSDSTTVVSNNRYIEFVPEKSGTVSITYKGSLESTKNYPRMYISCGDTTACMTKDANDSQLEANKYFDNKAGDNQYDTMTAELTAGNHYYIWCYYYSQTDANFTISEIVYDTNE